MKTAKAAWIFDIDGVITNLQMKTVNNPKILDLIAQKLNDNEPVALNTGRGLDWTIKNVINPIIHYVSDKKVLENFLAIGEKGGAWLTVNEDESKTIQIDKSLCIPSPLHKEIKNLVAKKYSEALKEYEIKPTMISFEMTTGFSYEKFKIIQKKLIQEINDLVKRTGLKDDLRVDPTRIAIDVEYQRVGKGFAMERILSWLKNKNILPNKIIAFGDSKSDFEMAQKAAGQSFQTEFVYVGGDNAFENIKTEIPIIIPKNKFEKGTLEYLQSV